MYSKTAAFIELAAASGINLLSEQERDCLATTTFGTGQLILDAVSRGLKQIFLFVGGSATNDGGIGILSALGIKALGDRGVLPPKGASLSRITSFDSSGCMVDDIHFTVVCDVMNPLYGPTGAAFVYAPQKGADEAAVELLDRGLRNLAKVIHENHGKKVDDFEGAGAAGGIAAGLKAFFPVIVKSGIESIMEIVKLSSAIESADLVITGEGKFDHQTLQGKVIKGVYDLCRVNERKLAVICGVLDLDETILKSLDFWKVKALVRSGISKEQAMQDAFDIVSQRAFEIISDS
jgi:glycerate kinase